MKRQFGISAAVIILVGVLSFVPRPLYADAKYKIGLIIPFSGPYGLYGNQIKRSVDLAVEDCNGKVLNKQVELVSEDSEAKPQVAVQKSTKLIAGGVDVMFGAFSSAATLAIMKTAEPLCLRGIKFILQEPRKCLPNRIILIIKILTLRNKDSRNKLKQ